LLSLKLQTAERILPSTVIIFEEEWVKVQSPVREAIIELIRALPGIGAVEGAQE
jgi:hypothetical protein